jgi:hypothetical protein
METTTQPTQNPSPSGDPWFLDPENIRMMEEGARQIREGKGIPVTQSDVDELLNYGIAKIKYNKT